MKLLIILGLLSFSSFIDQNEAFTKPLVSTWSSHNKHSNNAILESRAKLMENGEEGDGGGVPEEDEDEDDMMGIGPSKKSPPTRPPSNKKGSKSDDDIMSDLLKPKKDNGTTTMKPFMVVNNQKNKNKKPAKSDSDGAEESNEDLKSAIDSAMDKASSIAESIGDASATSNCSQDSSAAVAGEMTTPPSTKSGGPVSSTTKRIRRSSEVAKWPPMLPLAANYLPHKFADSEMDGMKNNHGDHSSNATAEGGVISQGQVGTSSSEESEDEHSGGGAVQVTTMANTDTSSSASSDAGAEEGKADETEDGSSASKMNVTIKSMPGRNTKTMKPASQRDVTLTISGAGTGAGTSSNGLYNQNQQVPTLPAFPIIRKPGKCRPLTSGLACIALSPDASQCSTDNGCPGTKKCCFYGCAPYTGIGISSDVYYWNGPFSHRI